MFGLGGVFGGGVVGGRSGDASTIDTSTACGFADIQAVIGLQGLETDCGFGKSGVFGVVEGALG